MILLSELKTMLVKAPILVLVLFIIPIFAVSAAITGTQNPTSAPYATDAEVATLRSRLEMIENNISTDNDYAQELFGLFDDFTLTWNPFFTYQLDPSNPESLSQFRAYFGILNQSYIAFDNRFTEVMNGHSRVLITSANFKTLENWMNETAKQIELDATRIQSLTASELEIKKHGLGVAWDRYKHQSNDPEQHGIYRIMKNLNGTDFTDEQITELKSIYTEKIKPKLDNPAQFQSTAHEANFLETANAYLELHMDIKHSQNQTNITRFRGFENFNQTASQDRLAILGFLLDNAAASFDYSTPLRINKVMHAQTGTTTYDFIFNNLELITIPLIILACLAVVICIYDDIKNNTVLSKLVAPQSRPKIITAKLFACAIVIAALIAVFVLLFILTALMLVGGSAPPTVLTAFGGKAILMSPFTMLFIYLLSLFFKILFFASIIALFCINAKSLKEATIKPAVIIVLIIALTFLFTVAVPFAFYQYLPLVSLDFAGFFGVLFMLSRHTASSFIWFTFPIMLIIWVAIITAVIVRFNKKDF